MTNQEHPKHNPNVRMPDRRMTDGGGMIGWVIGGVAALALIAGIAFMFSRDDGTTTATNNTNRPAAAQPSTPPGNPPTTTGAGTTAPAPNR
jgi:hypothetical protein